MVEAILEAGAMVFSSKGFAEATTNGIAEQAGVSVGSFYQYFPNKLALLEALRERHVRQLWEKIGSACHEASSQSLADGIRYIIAKCSAHNAAHATLLAMIHRELPIHRHGANQMTLAYSSVREKLRAFLEAHRNSLKVSVDQALFMIPALGRGIFTSAAIERPEAVKNERLVEDVVSAILGYLV
ncbi:MAG TPA: TetR/AcrR family transcriptional regulator [Opitutaceae bacterium]